jgi:UDP-3-O-[3-hydroxymyristoyl] N-acetylglucosamine deacetylase/UDP-3-O-[3-hydroxymyristoyl] N-acetylglucosamine deacetylase/3-hydroxyacyl-[acyl-carrier-protein] dehydratase
MTPETFVREIAFARTFVWESEVVALRAAGYGRRVTYQDLLVFDAQGQVIENELRAPDECVRHKILDCLGDFALIGCDLHGYINAYRSGHRHNHELIRRILVTHQTSRRSEAI